MKKVIVVLILLSACLIASAEVLDKIVARIGGDIILLSDLQKQTAQMQSTGIDVSKMSPLTILDGMIEQKLMIQKAKDLNIKVDESRIKSYAERYIRNIRSQYQNEAAFISDLAKMRLTQTDLLNYFIDQLTENALTEQLVDKYISSRVKLDEAEMRAYFEASKDSMAVKPVSWDLRMIMREVKTSPESETAKLDSINAILVRLQSGEDFATLATQYSECPSSSQGGDLGFFKRGMMVKPFEDAAFQLAIGEVSGVVQTQFGYHIIKLEEKKGEEIRVRHILKLLSASEADENREMDLMNAVRDQILSGVSFAELAGQYSMDPETAAEGGLLGDFTAEDLPDLFKDAILATPVGTVTEVLKNEDLLYLFIRDQEMQERVYTFDEVKDQLYNFMFQQKQMEAYDAWIEQLKTEAYVTISL